MILVTGATGTVGRVVVNLLLEDGERVAGVTRNPAAAQLPSGVRVVSGDPSRPQTLAAALSGVRAIFLVPRAVGGATGELLSLAVAQGVERVVLVSALTVEHAHGERRFIDAFKAAEDAVAASGLQWTFLRCADFAANTRVWVPQIRAGAIVRGAYGDAATSPIHERDIAAVGVRALVDAAHAGRAYLLTGPQSLTQRELVRLIGEAIGKELRWQELSPQQVRQAMIAQGMPDEIPDRMLGHLADCVQHPQPLSNAVEQVLGRPALTFAQWATDHAAGFRN
jgi:uncharacterized protein YbjT (DUF2867 family)